MRALRRSPRGYPEGSRPGVCQIRLTVGQVAGAPAGRRMDLADIHGVGMFVVSPERSFVLYFDGFRLEEQSRWKGRAAETAKRSQASPDPSLILQGTTKTGSGP